MDATGNNRLDGHLLPRHFTTCPPSSSGEQREYLQKVQEVAAWSEAAGCEGILVYTDNSLVDPWLVSQRIIESTERLCPLVAVQPVYMSPYSVAKMVASLAYLSGRRVWLNLVAGGFRNDLLALGDDTPHDRRYDRLTEYATIIAQLLRSGPVTFEGEFYRVENLRLKPELPPELYPGFTVSGSSEAGMAAARTLGAVAVQYPKPVDEALAAREESLAGGPLETGVRMGIVARPDGTEAWEVARDRFPEDRKGQLTHQLAMKVSDSTWHRDLGALGKRFANEQNPYWLVPFENYKTFCPYLVGSYERVATELARYMRIGHDTFISDVPANPAEIEHMGAVFQRARDLL